MYDRIAVPLDGSPFGEQALPVAVTLARRAGAELRLLHVHIDDVPVDFVEGLPSFDWVDEEVRDREADYLREVAERIATTGVSASPVLLDGLPSEAIAAYADEAEAALLVMSTHGRGLPSRAWIGSVADRVVRSVSVPVLLVRASGEAAEPEPERAEPFRRVLVPLDGSALAEQILDHAAALASLSGADCTLFAAVPPQRVVGGHVFHLDEEEAQRARANAERYLSRVAERLRGRVESVDARVVVEAQPATAILEAARAAGADLIALATHGRGGASRLVLGSTADKVLRSAPVPLLLFRPPSGPNER